MEWAKLGLQLFVWDRQMMIITTASLALRNASGTWGPPPTHSCPGAGLSGLHGDPPYLKFHFAFYLSVPYALCISCKQRRARF